MRALRGTMAPPKHAPVYINGLPNSVDSVSRLFADSTSLFINSSSFDHLECKLNFEINKVNDVYINDLPSSVDTVPRLLADDTCLFVNSSFLDHLECKLEIKINKVNKRIIANKLTVNAKKSNLLVINPKLNSSPTEMNLVCPAGSIKSVTKAKYQSWSP